ncbi:MAG: ABC transporter ATP-binding protein [Anaerolineae bacterium]|nr:ABC transporter ATP-binding protein [Anaerolineae bacterium]
MRDTALAVDGLSKRYRLGQAAPSDETLREVLARLFRPRLPWPPQRRHSARPVREVWALDNLSFTVQQGEAVGILGANGAGKSTLLRVLARITEPTLGSAEVFGRLNALLEVGTGFHPELTGRENIYLNSAILGRRHHETRRAFEAIVDFAEVAPFLDVPVKRYSSGMLVRLAFAVAVHLEPDILLVDEVLAVGDVAFQQKSLEKIETLCQAGHTLLFVSHNLALVERVCSRAILLERGRLVLDGPPGVVIARYLAAGMAGSGQVRWPPQGEVAQLLSAAVELEDGTPSAYIGAHQTFRVHLECLILQPLPRSPVSPGHPHPGRYHGFRDHPYRP